MQPRDRLDWLRPPRALLVLFAVLTLVPAAALVWLGLGLIAQDATLERQQIADRLDRVADRVAIGVSRELDDIERGLTPSPDPSNPWVRDPGTMTVSFRGARRERHAGAPMVFVPHQERAPDPPHTTWTSTDLLEYARSSPDAAIAALRLLATSTSDARVRAGALMRLARNLRRVGRSNDALAIYKRLAAGDTVSLQGDPSDLVGRHALCDLLSATEAHADLDREARRLRADLAAAKWTLDRTSYEYYSGEVSRWAVPPDAGERDAAALAAAVASLWEEWAGLGRPAAFAGRRASGEAGRSVLLLWRVDQDRLLVFAATAGHLAMRLRSFWEDQPAEVSFVDATGRVVVGQAQERTGLPEAVRTGSETQLPWTLRVVSSDPPPERAALALRRQSIHIGLALLAFLIPGGGYVVLRAVKKELAVARLQSDFVSAVSHEFRTPLTSMTHLTAVLRGGAVLTGARTQEYIYTVLAREVDRLSRFVETLLEFGRMQAGAARYTLEAVDAGSLVDHVVGEFVAGAAAGDHPVTVHHVASSPSVRANREAFGHMLWNLLDNAAKYSAPGTPIDVRIEIEREAAAVRVQDRGPGVPPDERDAIFQRFVRGAAARRSGVRGTGVGLAIVAHIARAHGGTVALDATAGGSTFTIRLPIVPARAATAPAMAGA